MLFLSNFFSSYLSGATIAFQRAELQFFLLVGFSEEMSQWRGWGGGEEQDASASLRDKVGSLSKIHTYYMWSKITFRARLDFCCSIFQGLNFDIFSFLYFISRSSGSRVSLV